MMIIKQIIINNKHPILYNINIKVQDKNKKNEQSKHLFIEGLRANHLTSG